MSTSPNLGLNLQTTGSNNGTWGVTLNSDLSIVDSRMGSRIAVNCAGSSNIVVNSNQAQNFFQDMTGILTGNIKYILPAQGGFYFITNDTTGAFSVTIVNDVSGTGVVISQGSSQLVMSNPDNTTVYSVIPGSFAATTFTGQITSTVTTGSAPFIVASTTKVSNLSVDRAALADTVTTNANLTGDITSVGNDSTLATVNSSVGSFRNSAVTVNAKGLVTAASDGVINQNIQSSDYTTVLSDNAKQIFHPSADTTARTWTIDSNANVAYPIGAAITFVNQDSAGVITISITSDTLWLAGAGTTGNRTLAANGIATAIKITTTGWLISGTGLT